MPAKAPSPVTPFNAQQLAALDVLMDRLIPASPDGRMPAARTLGLFLDPAPMRAQDRDLFEQGLADLQARAMHLKGCSFAALDGDQVQGLIDALRAEGSAFLRGFMLQTVGRYMAHPLVMPLIGLEARPMWPKGNPVAEGDWSLLQVVRQRDKIYRRL